MKSFMNTGGESVVMPMVKAIEENPASLSEVDGATRDGVDGISMRKGLAPLGPSILPLRLGGFTDIRKTLGRVLMAGIGGSRGPSCGTFFIDPACAGRDTEVGHKQVFFSMLEREGSGSTGCSARSQKPRSEVRLGT